MSTGENGGKGYEGALGKVALQSVMERKSGTGWSCPRCWLRLLESTQNDTSGSVSELGGREEKGEGRRFTQIHVIL